VNRPVGSARSGGIEVGDVADAVLSSGKWVLPRRLGRSGWLGVRHDQIGVASEDRPRGRWIGRRGREVFHAPMEIWLSVRALQRLADGRHPVHLIVMERDGLDPLTRRSVNRDAALLGQYRVLLLGFFLRALQGQRISRILLCHPYPAERVSGEPDPPTYRVSLVGLPCRYRRHITNGWRQAFGDVGRRGVLR